MTEPPEDNQSKANSAKDPHIGQIVDGRFQIESALGQGGMSTVYRAKDLNLDRLVALKVLSAQELTGSAAERFKREMMAGGMLDHPGIIKVLSSGLLENGRPYIVMELLPGKTLAQVLEAGPLTDELFLDLFCQILEALQYAHGRGILHRDLKPSNIMVLDDLSRRQSKILDFGIAKLLENADQKLTQTGAIVGSAPYMSPEQCLGRDVDQRTDLYSLGCVMYESLCGAPPWQSDSSLDLMYKHVHDAPPAIATHKTDVRSGYAQLISKALQKDPAARFQSAQNMLEALKKASSEQLFRSEDSREKAAASPWRLRDIMIVASFILLAVATVLGSESWKQALDPEGNAPGKFDSEVAAGAETILSRAHLAQKQGHRDDAIKIMRDWLAANQQSRNLSQLARVRSELALVLAESNHQDEACKIMDALQNDYEHLEGDALKMNVIRIQLRVLQLAEKRERLLELAELGRKLYQSSTCSERKFFEDAASVGDVLLECYHRLGEYQKCVDNSASVQDLFVKSHQRPDYFNGPRKCIADSLRLVGRTAEAEQVYKERVTVANSLPNNRDKDLMIGAYLRDLGVFYKQLKKYDLSKKCLRESLIALDKHKEAGRANADLYEDMAITHMTLADTYLDSKPAGASWKEEKLWREEVEAAARSLEQISDTSKRSRQYYNIAERYFANGRYKESLPYLKQSMDSYVAINKTEAAADVACVYLRACSKIGQFEQGLQTVRALAKRMKGVRNEGVALSKLADVYQNYSLPDDAIVLETYERALACDRAAGSKRAVAGVQARLARFHAAHKNLDKAQLCIDEALSLTQENVQTEERLTADKVKAEILTAQGRLAEAMEFLHTCNEQLVSSDNPARADLAVMEMECCINAGNLAAAETAYKRALQIADEYKLPIEKAHALRLQAKVLSGQGKVEQAVTAMNEALPLFLAGERPDLAASGCLLLSDIYRRGKQNEPALEALYKAREYCRSAKIPGMELNEIGPRLKLLGK